MKNNLGQYMTPPEITDWMAKWVSLFNPEKVLEPSFGTGNFIAALNRLGMASSEIHGIELDRELFAYGYRELAKFPKYRATCGNFLAFCLTIREPVDAVIGNPPFISHLVATDCFQDYSKAICYWAKIQHSKMMNMWILFAAASLIALNDKGVFALVLPTDIISAPWAKELRRLFAREKCKVAIVETRKPMFPDVEQSVCIVLAQKGMDKHEVAYVPLSSLKEMTPEQVWELKGADVSTDWNFAQLSPQVRELLEILPEKRDVKRLCQLAHVAVPPPTGANKFFFVNDAILSEYDLIRWSNPAFSGPQLCRSILYEYHDWANQAVENKRVYLLSMPPDVEKHAGPRRYIHKYRAYNPKLSYKCAQHTPEWWCLPKGFTRPECFLLKRYGDVARLIRNDANVIVGDCAMKIEPKKQGIADKLTVNFANPLTMLTAELYGKRFGGGVLEISPRAADELLIPWPDTVNDPSYLHTLAVMHKPEDIVRNYGKILLLKVMGLDEAQAITDAWLTLRERRLKGEGQ